LASGNQENQIRCLNKARATENVNEASINDWGKGRKELGYRQYTNDSTTRARASKNCSSNGVTRAQS
jgi:hypothetical protein